MMRIATTAVLAISLLPSAHATQFPLVDVAHLSARGAHACVVTNAGSAKCWGSNGRGELGSPVTGPDDYRTAATDVVGLASGAVSISAATGAHTCAIVTGGGVKCWGANEHGQLGDGTTTTRGLPGDVLGLPGPAVEVAGGEWHTCALTAQGAVSCWGDNFTGQLGDGTQETRLSATPVVGLSSGVVAIAVGPWHACAITDAGALKCWGWNSEGALGDGTLFASHLTPTDVVGLSSDVSAVAAGGDEGAPFFQPEAQTCAIVSGVVKCWGASTLSGTPMDVAGVGPATQISIGGYRYYGGSHATEAASQFCALTPDGSVHCWGSNWCGMAGGPNFSCGFPNFDNIPPTQVTGLSSPVASVSAAALRTCALRTDARVDCWGLGSSVPQPATEGTTPQTIAFYSSDQPNNIPIGTTVQLHVAYGGGSGNPIVMSSLTPQVCSVSGGYATTLAAGLCTVEANQAGNAYYDAATPARVDITVTPYVAQAITFDLLPAQLEAGDAATVTAHSSSGLPVVIETTFSSGLCTVWGNIVRAGQSPFLPGTCYLQAREDGDATYAPALVHAQFPIVANTGTVSLVVYARGGGVGTVTSSPAAIDCGILCAADFATGSSVTLTASAPAGSVFDGWLGACSGTGPCTVTMDQAKTVTALFDDARPRLSALSTRGRVVYGNDTLIGGFIIGGSGEKTVMVRARGRSLAPVISGPALFNPTMRIFDAQGNSVAANNDIFTAPNLDVINALGFGLSDNGESGILVTLPAGGYTAIVTPASENEGLGLFEVFEVDRADFPLIGISTRGTVRTGDEVMIAGFIVEGNAPQKVAVRARGPSLAAAGVQGALADPMLDLVRSSDQTLIATNDNWRDAANAAQIEASGFAPGDDLEATILITLDPGAYTAIMRGVGGTSGNGIVEVYRVTN